MRIDQRHEQAEWVGRSFAALQELDDAFTAHPRYLAGRSIDISGYISTVVVRVAAAGRVIPVEDAERSSLRLLNGGARIRRVPAGPPPIRLHNLDVGGPPVFAAVAWGGVRGVAEVPLAFPDHVVTGVGLEEGGNGRLMILVHQSGP